MKTYKVTVNDKTYVVKVEEKTGAIEEIENVVTKEKILSGNKSFISKNVESPMPGTLIDVLVKVGDKIEVNQVLAIIETMKMENEIVSEFSGIVAEVRVKKGDMVEASEILFCIGS